MTFQLFSRYPPCCSYVGGNLRRTMSMWLRRLCSWSEKVSGNGRDLDEAIDAAQFRLRANL